VVYGDHGQLFHEIPGYVTHAREPYDLEVRVPCLVYAPALLEPAVDDYPVELVDLAPSVLGLLGWPPHPNFQGRNVLASDRPPLETRAVFLLCETPISRADAVVVAGRWKLLRDRNRRTQALFDLEADPRETTDLASREPERLGSLARLLETWRARQFAYYA